MEEEQGDEKKHNKGKKRPQVVIYIKWHTKRLDGTKVVKLLMKEQRNGIDERALAKRKSNKRELKAIVSTSELLKMHSFYFKAFFCSFHVVVIFDVFCVYFK